MKPLGYWLIHIHELLETGFERLLEGERLTRRHWQVLNTLASKPHTANELEAALKPFDFQPELDDLIARGWVGGSFELTPVGREAHQRVSARVHDFRAKVIDGISTDEYATLMNLLERVATNVAALV